MSTLPVDPIVMDMDEEHGSPEDDYGHDDQNTSALERHGFKIQLGEKKTRDGQAPKRRGPKPDSKPALTRRQELNRQAQRTHRERKELYIKALEQEVYRLKETQETTVRAKESCNEQCRQLKSLLAAHGIAFDAASPVSTAGYTATPQLNNGNSSHSSIRQSSMSTGFTSPPMPHAGLMKTENYDLPMGQPIGQPMRPGNYQPQVHQGIDYEQMGVDFVLTLESSCKQHIALLMVRAQKKEEDVSGHALMASCPPISYIENYVREHPEDPHVHPHALPDLPGNLAKLLVCSTKVDWDEQLKESEVTPIAAWQWVWQHPRFSELRLEDIANITEGLKEKTRCYGFGSVIESFEIRDAVEDKLAMRASLENRNSPMNAMTVNTQAPWSPGSVGMSSPPLPKMRDLHLGSMRSPGSGN